MPKEPKVKIVLLEVGKYDRRTVAEKFENSVFETYKEAMEVLGEEAGIYELSDFMDVCNDQEIDLEQYWVTYITINE